MDVDAAEEAGTLSPPALIYCFVLGALEGADECTRLPDVSWFLNMCQCVQFSKRLLFINDLISLKVFELGDLKQNSSHFLLTELLMLMRKGIQAVEVFF